MRLLTLLGLLLTSPSVLASESCFSSVARMLVDREVNALAQRIVSSTPDTAASIRWLTEQTGYLTKLRPGEPAGFPATFQRITIRSPAASGGYESRMVAFSASSESLGPVRIRVHLHTGLECAVLAINVDSAYETSKQ
jgi:hypothetical protein